MPQAIRSILDPTDFSDLSGAALAHALRVALAARSQLHLLHITQREPGGTPAFPQVRRLLVQWGLAGEDDPPWVVSDSLGLEVDSITVRWQDPAQGILSYLDQRPAISWCSRPMAGTGSSAGCEDRCPRRCCAGWQYRRCS